MRIPTIRPHAAGLVLLGVLLFPGVARGDDIGPERPGVFERALWRRASTEASLTDAATFEGSPERRDTTSAAIGFEDAGDGYVQRIRGWLEVPTTGAYRFAIASDDDSILLLSPEGDVDTAAPVAQVSGFTGPMSFGAEGQVSRPVTLIRGQRIYLEARHRDGTGGDHLVIAWKAPRSGFDRPMPIGLVIEPAFEVEIWRGVAEADPATMDVFGTPPDRVVRTFEAATPADLGVNVAARLTGTWTAPSDGAFVFMLSADDRARLVVRRAGGSGVLGEASLSSWTAPTAFEGRASQVTAPITLRRGEKVALEGRLWQGSGPGHLAIGVRGPGIDARPMVSPPTRPEPMEGKAGSS